MGAKSFRAISHSYNKPQSLVHAGTEDFCTEENARALDGGGRERLPKDRNVRGGPDDLAPTGVWSGLKLRSDLPPTI